MLRGVLYPEVHVNGSQKKKKKKKTPGPICLCEKVLNFVRDLVQSNHSNLLICVTSRPEQDINVILNPLTSPSRRVSLHEEGGQWKTSTASSALSSRMIGQCGDGELVIRVLSERAQGM